MGLDGFSMGNLGLNTDLTSAQMANQAEQIAKKESAVKIKDVTKSAEDSGVKRKEEEEDEGKNQFDDGFKKKKEDTEEENETENHSVLSEKDFNFENSKEFSIRINPDTDLVELVNKKEEKVLETMSANDLMYLISKMNSASGVLFSRKI